MYKGKKISVAMATYNGEKFIEEQLMSICNNTVKPDEIIISDDGSKDGTLEIVRAVAKSEAAQGIEFVTVTDNPHRGFVGNFEWALKHTSGDYIFLSDQDDVWMPEKVAEMLEVFQHHPDAECVIHNAVLVDANGEYVDDVFDERFTKGKLLIPEGKCTKIDRETYLSEAVFWGGPRGMSMCITRRLFESAYPFYGKTPGHDTWLGFCAILNDTCYYLNSLLAKYRIHQNNTSAQTTVLYKPTVWKRFVRKFKYLPSMQGIYRSFSYYNARRDRVEEFGYTETDAYIRICRFCKEIEKLYEAETGSRISGVIKLIRLYRKKKWLRNQGKKQLIFEIIYILRYSKKYRIEAIGDLK